MCKDRFERVKLGTMETKNPRKLVIELVYSVVYTDVEAYTKDIAREHTILNMGQSLENSIQGPADMYVKLAERRQFISYAFNRWMECEEGMEDAYNKEYKSWVSHAKKQVKEIQKAGVPLTLQSARDHWERKGAFAKK